MDNLEDLNCRLARYLTLASWAQERATTLDNPDEREEWRAIAISWTSLAEYIRNSMRRSV
jgi:hypothetical protein